MLVRSTFVALVSAGLAMSGAAAQELPVALAQSSVPAGSGGPAQAVARMVHGIVGYTRWPSAPAVVNICIAGIPRFAGAIGAAGRTGQRIAARRVNPAALRAPDCNALYLGSMAPADRAALLARMRGSAVVTIDENDPACRAGAMICLRIGRAQAGFELNVDAVSRSTVRIDPRVLRLSQSTGDDL